jgi:hypothetical protein
VRAGLAGLALVLTVMWLSSYSFYTSLPAQVAAPDSEQVGSEAICIGAPVECFCKSFKTEASCRTASPTCLWYYGRCAPAYE